LELGKLKKLGDREPRSGDLLVVKEVRKIMKKVKIIVYLLVGLLLIWFSFDFRSLDKHRAELKPEVFDAAVFASNYWKEMIPVSVDEAPQPGYLLDLLNNNPDQAFGQYGRKLGISKVYYFMLKGEGIIEKADREFIIVKVDENTSVKIATDFIYGNAVRDGSGKVNIDEFLNMTDFNLVSVALNKIVREEVAAPLRSNAKAGQRIEFAGAFELNSENVNIADMLIMPVLARLSDGNAP
jgi:hypothetical protein